jgi:hypothetical protein
VKINYFCVALIAITAESSSYSAELDFEIRAGLSEGGSRDLSLRFVYDDSSGDGARAAAGYEKKSDRLSREERFEAFRHYIFRLQLVQAERLAEELALERGDARASVALGLARLCRGDYERSVTSLKAAEEAGARPAAQLRVYVTCVILQRPDEVENTVKQMLKTGELNSSRLAANAVLGFCLVGKEGPKLFEQVIKQIDRQLLLSNPSLLETYVGLCRKYGKSDEVQSLREQYERRKGSAKP